MNKLIGSLLVMVSLSFGCASSPALHGPAAPNSHGSFLGSFQSFNANVTGNVSSSHGSFFAGEQSDAPLGVATHRPTSHGNEF